MLKPYIVTDPISKCHLVPIQHGQPIRLVLDKHAYSNPVVNAYGLVEEVAVTEDDHHYYFVFQVTSPVDWSLHTTTQVGEIEIEADTSDANLIVVIRGTIPDVITVPIWGPTRVRMAPHQTIEFVLPLNGPNYWTHEWESLNDHAHLVERHRSCLGSQQALNTTDRFPRISRFDAAQMHFYLSFTDDIEQLLDGDNGIHALGTINFRRYNLISPLHTNSESISAVVFVDCDQKHAAKVKSRELIDYRAREGCIVRPAAVVNNPLDEPTEELVPVPFGSYSQYVTRKRLYYKAMLRRFRNVAIKPKEVKVLEEGCTMVGPGEVISPVSEEAWEVLNSGPAYARAHIW